MMKYTCVSVLFPGFPVIARLKASVTSGAETWSIFGIAEVASSIIFMLSHLLLNFAHVKYVWADRTLYREAFLALSYWAILR